MKKQMDRFIKSKFRRCSNRNADDRAENRNDHADQNRNSAK